jgi:hypothetical protein
VSRIKESGNERGRGRILHSLSTALQTQCSLDKTVSRLPHLSLHPNTLQNHSAPPLPPKKNTHPLFPNKGSTQTALKEAHNQPCITEVTRILQPAVHKHKYVYFQLNSKENLSLFLCTRSSVHEERRKKTRRKVQRLLSISTLPCHILPQQQQTRPGLAIHPKRAGGFGIEDGYRARRMSEACPHIAGSVEQRASLRPRCGLDYRFAP